jgi:PCFT/HCP family folate transporter-like MFS transporter 1/3
MVWSFWGCLILIADPPPLTAALIVAFPFGMLADKVGRRPTALFAYSGLWMSFALSTTFLGSFKYTIRRHPYYLMFGNFWLLFGGGAHVLIATLYAIAADVTDEKDR